jgi:hypothetical protein
MRQDQASGVRPVFNLALEGQKIQVDDTVHSGPFATAIPPHLFFDPQKKAKQGLGLQVRPKQNHLVQVTVLTFVPPGFGFPNGGSSDGRCDGGLQPLKGFVEIGPSVTQVGSQTYGSLTMHLILYL